MIYIYLERSFFEILGKLIFRHPYYLHNISSSFQHTICCLPSLFTILGFHNFSSSLGKSTSCWINSIDYSLVNICKHSNSCFGALLYFLVSWILLKLFSFLWVLKLLSNISSNLFTKFDNLSYSRRCKVKNIFCSFFCFCKVVFCIFAHFFFLFFINSFSYESSQIFETFW